MDQNQQGTRKSARIPVMQQRAAARAAERADAEREAQRATASRTARRRAATAAKRNTRAATERATRKPANQPAQPPRRPVRTGPRKLKLFHRVPSSSEEDEEQDQTPQGQPRVHKRKRTAMKHWRRVMEWPPEILLPKGLAEPLPTGPDAPEVSPKEFGEIKELAGSTLSGFSGYIYNGYSIPSGWNKDTRANAIEEPIGTPITRGRRNELYHNDQSAGYLRKWGCMLDDSETKTQGPTDDQKELCRKLFRRQCSTPRETLFGSEDDFRYIRKRLKRANENALLRLVGDLIVPHAELAVLRGQVTEIENLKDSMSDPWTRSIPFDEQSARLPHRYIRKMKTTGHVLPMPQPDHTVGFYPNALEPKHQLKLAPQMHPRRSDEHPKYFSLFEGVPGMYFPFLTAETKLRLSAFKIAERANAHSMAVAMRGIIGLFKRINTQKPKELHRRVLGFSITYDYERVKIHAHYPVIEDKDDDGNEADGEGENLKITYHRWIIEDLKWGTEGTKWTSYQFVMAVYNDWVPLHLEMLREAIEELPDESDIGVDLPEKGTGTNAPAVPDPQVPDVDFDRLRRLEEDHKQALREDGLIRTPDGSDVPEIE